MNYRKQCLHIFKNGVTKIVKQIFMELIFLSVMPPNLNYNNSVLR